MLKKLKHGFTLVELVIVIAVIAVLAAVLIPTFITVIDNANNSADLQLTRNMNTVLSTEVYADQTATAENLRKLLKDNGLNNLTTKKKDNIIAYHQSANKFELINLSKANITTEELSTGTAATVEADVSTDGALVIDPNPFSFAEIFKDYTIVSTGGNDLAEAIYGFYNIQFDSKSNEQQLFPALWKKVCDINIDSKIKEAVIGGLRTLVNESVFVYTTVTLHPTFGKIVSGGMIFATVNEDNVVEHTFCFMPNADSYKMDGTNYCYTSSNWGLLLAKAMPTSTDARTFYFNKTHAQNGLDVKITPSRVFILETAPVLDVFTLGILDSAVVVIPDNVESVKFPGSLSTLNILSNVMFLGNTEVLTEATGGDMTKLYGAQVSSMHIQEIKESVKKFGATVAQAAYYVSNAESDKDKPGYYSDLNEALQAAKNSAEAVKLPREVILASDYEIESGTINIPQNVTLHVPYAIEGGIKTGQGTGEKTTLVDDELGTETNANYQYKGQTFKQCTFTIAAGANLTVEGTLEIGAELCPDLMTFSAVPGYKGCVGGNYGQIDNSGTITVKDGGRLNSYGYIKCKEDGKVVVGSGATVFEPMVVTEDWSVERLIDFVYNDTQLNGDRQRKFPFMRYSLPNITNLEIKYGGLLSVVNVTDEVIGYFLQGECYFVGSDKTPEKYGLLTLESGGSVVIKYEYNKDKAIKDDTASNNLAGDIGINTATLYGNVKTGIVLRLNPTVQQECLCYIPYNFEFEITSGCTFNVTNKYVALPGAKVTVQNGGTLSVANGGEFYVVDDYNSDGEKVLDGKSYPTKLLKEQSWYSERGVIIQGTFEVKTGAKVGGTLQVVENAKIVIEEKANLKGEFIIGIDAPQEGGSNKQEYTGEKALPLKYKKKGESTETTVSEKLTDGAGTITVA